MANKGYASVADVGNYLGLTLTSDQQALATTLLGAAEAFIDQESRLRDPQTGYGGWNLPAILNERYDMRDPVLYLKHSPVTSVQSVYTRTQAVGDPLRLMVAGSEYELFDPSTGQINFAFGYYGSSSFLTGYYGNSNYLSGSRASRMIAFVSYTPNRPVPADIAQVAARIAAHSMTLSLNPDRLGITSVQLDAQTKISYDGDGGKLLVSQADQAIIRSYRPSRIV